MALDIASLMSAAGSSGGAAGGAGAGALGGLGGLASATPYGAAINAAAGLAGEAMKDTPTNVTSGSGSYQSGPFTVGAKMVGGKGNSAGATTATASQTPAGGEAAASSLTQNPTTLYVIIGAVLLAFLGVIFALGRRK